MKGRNLTEMSLSSLFDDENISNFSCLDLFAKDGKRQSYFFYERSKSLEMWEIDEKIAGFASFNFPNAKVINCDSVKRLANSDWDANFDLILVDNPLSTYCENKYCENFDVIIHIHKCFRDNAMCLLNIVTEPFDIDSDDNKEWKSRREKFYSKNFVSIEEAIEKYKEEFNKSGIYVERVKFSEREEFNNKTYLYHALFSLKKLKK